MRRFLPSFLKSQIKTCLSSPLFAPLRNCYCGNGSLLMYHRITAVHDPERQWRESNTFSPHLGLSVSCTRFEEQMKYLREYTTPISISEIDTIWKTEKRDKPYVIVTFDDGYRDNLELALPIAEEYEIPITIFVTTGYMERTYVPWWIYLEGYLRARDSVTLPFVDGSEMDISSLQKKQYVFDKLDVAFRQMTVVEQCAALKRMPDGKLISEINALFLSKEELKTFAEHPLVTIGAHTVNHPVLAVEEEEIAKAEIVESMNCLEETLGVRPDFFAYPFGDRDSCGEREARICEELKLKGACTTRSGHIFPEHAFAPHLLPRLTIDYFDDLSSFHRKLSGIESLCVTPFSRCVTL